MPLLFFSLLLMVYKKNDCGAHKKKYKLPTINPNLIFVIARQDPNRAVHVPLLYQSSLGKVCMTFLIFRQNYLRPHSSFLE